MENYILEKSIWTEQDFDQMGWHDANIYGFIFYPVDDERTDLIFDIDYIFKWVNPIPPEQYFSFWVSPCTLKFEDIFDIKMEIDRYKGMTNMLDIDDLELISVENGIYEWSIELHDDYISFKSSGFKQFVRQKPIFGRSQVLSLEERKGIGFSEITF